MPKPSTTQAATTEVSKPTQTLGPAPAPAAQPSPGYPEGAAVLPPAVTDVLTLAIDIGGTRLKAGLLNGSGGLAGGPARVDTPHPGPPASVIAALEGIIAGLGHFDRISIGFPGVVRHGRVMTAPNLGTEAWRDYPLVAEMQRRFGRPARLLNDASVQGLGVISGQGLECVITLGTGMGFALFESGRLAPHLEMGQHRARKNLTYDHYIGNAAYEAIGRKRWNRRLRRVIAAIDELVMYDALLIGGGNAKDIDFELPPRVRTVPNEAGIAGGVRLWDPRMESVFTAAT